MAELMVKNKEQDLAITRNLFGKGFVTAVDVKKGELEVLTCQNDLKKAESDLNVLAQADKLVERTKKENAANINRYQAALAAAEQTLRLRNQLTTNLKEQLENC